MRNLSKKAKTIIAGAAIAGLASTGVAYAYWTTTGAGDGYAANAPSNGTVTLHASWTAGALFPGGSQSVSFTADKPAATDLYVGTISLRTLDPVTVDSGHSTCVVADFTMDPVPENTIVTHGSGTQALPNPGSLVFANSASDQEACKGAIITLHLTSN